MKTHIIMIMQCSKLQEYLKKMMNYILMYNTKIKFYI